MNSNLPLITILGPTASGKTGYAINLARLLNGEIVCADSRTVYKGMDVGTAKPTKNEQKIVPHWALDLVEPNQRFTLYDFQHYATQKIAEIRKRGHVPMLVGGSGLYIDCVVYNYDLPTEPAFNPVKRAQLEEMNLNELFIYAHCRGVRLPETSLDKRRIIRVIERGGVNKKCSQLIDNTVVIGILTDRAILRERSRWRAQQMLADSLIEESDQLRAKYGDIEPLQRNAYGIIWQYRGGQITKNQLVDKLVTADGHLVKKQLTWWRNQRRADDIMWQSLSLLNSQLERWRGEDSRQIVQHLKTEYKKFRATS